MDTMNERYRKKIVIALIIADTYQQQKDNYELQQYAKEFANFCLLHLHQLDSLAKHEYMPKNRSKSLIFE